MALTSPPTFLSNPCSLCLFPTFWTVFPSLYRGTLCHVLERISISLPNCETGWEGLDRDLYFRPTGIMPSATVHVVLSPPSRALPGRHMLRSRHSCARATPIISVRLGTWLGECWSYLLTKIIYWLSKCFLSPPAGLMFFMSLKGFGAIVLSNYP